MLSRLENLRFLNANMIETLATTDFRLTFRTMQRLIPQAESRSKWYEILDESEDTPIEVYFEFTQLEVDEGFFGLRFTSDEEFPNLHRKHISDLTLPLTQEMAELLAERDWFVLYIDTIDRVSPEVYASFLKHLMAAIPADKYLFVLCPMANFESPLETLI